MCLHVTLFSIFAIISMAYISLFTLNLPKDMESKAYLSRAIFNNCIACLMKLNLFMIDMMMLYMFVKFQEACDEKFRKICEDKRASLPLDTQNELVPKYAYQMKM